MHCLYRYTFRGPDIRGPRDNRTLNSSLNKWPIFQVFVLCPIVHREQMNQQQLALMSFLHHIQSQQKAEMASVTMTVVTAMKTHHQMETGKQKSGSLESGTHPEY